MKLLNMTAWGYLLGCLFFLGLFVLAAGFTLTTSQLLFIYGFIGVSQLHYGWGVLWQMYNAVNGQYSGTFLIAVIISWVLLGCYTIANSIKKWVKQGIAHEGLEFFCHGLLLLDGLANWVSLSGVPWYWQAIFTLVIFIALGHFGKISIGLAHMAILEFF